MAHLLVFLVLLFSVVISSDAGAIIFTGRIINGNTVNGNDFPWHASIEAVSSSKSIQCSGSIISSEWILTAGQCVNGYDNFTITLGSKSRGEPLETVVSNVSIIHPKYKGSLTNDIALIKLPTPLDFSDNIAPANIPDLLYQGVTFVGCKSRVAGWKSSTHEGTKLEDDPLYWVELSIITNTKCAQYLGSQITDASICADALKDGNISRDDYGAALVTMEDGAWMQIGVASHVQSMAAGTMSAYMRLSSYRQWIDQEIANYELRMEEYT